MRIDVLTIFPKMFDTVLGESIVKRAKEKRVVEINVIDLRLFSKDKHRKVDDKPFGGGPGMVMNAEPFFEAVNYIRKKTKDRRLKTRTILLTPKGKKFDQALALKLSKYEHMVLLCGHYEGIDERVAEGLADAEISIGDFVLTGGELPAMVIIDSIVRLLPGALGDENSSKDESFSENFLEYPHYTRPADYNGMKVPDVLLSGDHEKIKEWRKKEALKITKKKRPDLISNS
ncbi:MAG: tRNA (guanosine(37)-N1)-methyltransferase TrmD [Candidatus Omnitrophota bacterium]|jgi:tRNA (guanine37-N1)-methyltransferase|nr:MAG: tRNA (guanosine(37)-N1)-methyltransferase TrmD [Omnitrophica bacterium GWA2_41_15]HAZ11048.1 tRNA (guanosine(37)-N1)-methyltransferase TrmD [Candidatus Omnitrophota bacterium]